MLNLLCEFSRSFPVMVADILEREKHTRRNFREETVTDLLMAGLTAFRPFGILVFFPDEPLTGADMDWQFVSPNAPNGKRFLHLRIQAKRAIQSKSKTQPYWYYRELDHESPKGSGKGSQSRTLVSNAKADGATPLYIFYHPKSALDVCQGNLPAIEGVNLMLADLVPGNCIGRRSQTVSKWRPDFLSFSELLCAGDQFKEFSSENSLKLFLLYHSLFLEVSPGKIADVLENSYQTRKSRVTAQGDEVHDDDRRLIQARASIPDDVSEILRSGEMSRERRLNLHRPLAIFYNRVPALLVT